jgi:cobalt/nickel transport system permease protein
VGVIVAIVKLKNTPANPNLVPLMVVCAGFIFVAQMLNFDIPNGTSGHLLGGTLCAVLIGPWAATLIMSIVITVQAVVFQDGGLIVLGANICNMGLVATLGGFWLYSWLSRYMGFYLAVVFTAWLSVVVAAIITAGQLAISGTTELFTALQAMLYWHWQIGLGEALVSLAVLVPLRLWRPELFWQTRGV